MLRLLSYSLLLMVFVGASLSAETGGSDKASIMLGRKTYGKKCKNCHGPKGKGKTSMAKRMNVGDLSGPSTQGKSNEELAQIISEGVPQMPGYGNKLSDKEIKALVDYMRTF